jgi:DNA-binding Xre family transcriptional regulator
MERKRVSRPAPKRTPEETARVKQLREKFQREKPSLARLVASGEYSAPVSQGEWLGLLQFVAQLKELRMQRKLSLADIAERTGIDKAAISRIENGLNPNPTVVTLEALSRALGARLKLVLEESPH